MAFGTCAGPPETLDELRYPLGQPWRFAQDSSSTTSGLAGSSGARLRSFRCNERR